MIGCDICVFGFKTASNAITLMKPSENILACSFSVCEIIFSGIPIKTPLGEGGGGSTFMKGVGRRRVFRTSKVYMSL